MNRVISFCLASCFLLVNTAMADMAKGKESYAQRCASCHGVAGAGDGPVAAAMPPGTIANLIKGPFKFATNGAKLKELLEKGGAAVGLNPLMTGAVGAPDSEVADLVEFVLSLQKQ